MHPIAFKANHDVRTGGIDQHLARTVDVAGLTGIASVLGAADFAACGAHDAVAVLHEHDRLFFAIRIKGCVFDDLALRMSRANADTQTDHAESASHGADGWAGNAARTCQKAVQKGFGGNGIGLEIGHAHLADREADFDLSSILMKIGRTLGPGRRILNSRVRRGRHIERR